MSVFLGSLGIAVMNPCILVCERAQARSHTKIRPIPWEFLETPFLKLVEERNL